MASPSASDASSSRLLFGSCNSLDHEQVLWQHILQRNASAFVWGGDAVYTDAHVDQATPSIAKKLYQEQLDHPQYKQLIDSGIPIFGALDDHDFGQDNGDKTYPYRVESGVLFACEFLRNQTKMCERAKRGKGVYGVQVMDFSRPRGSEWIPEGEAGLDPDLTGSASPTPLGNQTVAIFLLDIRSHKTPYQNKFGPGPGDFLGETQWKWLEKAFGQSTAAVNLIISGLQVHADRRPAESWSRFPDSQDRLYQAILQNNVMAPILVSGDVHHAQLLRRDCSPQGADAKQILLEVTTSGMTHSWGSREQCARPHRAPWMCSSPFVQWLFSRGMRLAQHFNGYLSWTELLYLDSNQLTSEGTAGLQFSLDRNFAEMEFDWEERTVVIRVLGQDSNASPLLSHKWSLLELSPRMGGSNGEGPWICENYRGETGSAMKVIGFVVPASIVLAGFWSPFLLVACLAMVMYRRWARRPIKSKKA